MTFTLKDILVFFIILAIVTICTFVYASIPSYYCPQCNTHLGFYVDQKYCSECGYKLDTLKRKSILIEDKYIIQKYE